MKGTPLWIFCHEYRFLLGSFLLVLLLGWYVDLKPRWDEFAALLEQEKNLSQQIAEKERALQQAGPVAARLRTLQLAKTKRPLLDQMLQAAQLNLCQVASLQTEIKKNDNQSSKQQAESMQNNQLIIRMHLYSDFVSFYRFIDTLAQQALPLRLDHFSLKDQRGWLDIVVQFSVFPWAFWLADQTKRYPSQEPCCVRDPFGDAPLSLQERMASKPENYSARFALAQLRYVGYLAQANKTAALILLPDGRIDEVYPGARLGQEAWRVWRIHVRYLTLIDQQQKQWLQLVRTI